MKRIIVFSVLLAVVAVWFTYGCGIRQKPKIETVVIPGGTVASAVGVGFDAVYDQSLDNVVPGYKILNVVYTNNSMNVIQMDSENDKWWIEDRKGKKVKAIINLRNIDPDAWGKLPKGLKVRIQYPLLVSIGKDQVIDLLFEKRVNLGEFRSVIYRPGNSRMNYKILPREQ